MVTPFACRADGHGELVVALVGVVEDGVAKRVPDVLVCYAVLACGCEDFDPHSDKVTCRVAVVKLTWPVDAGGFPRLKAR